MNKIKVVLSAVGALFAMAFIFGCAAGEDEDKKCGFVYYNSDTHKCCGFSDVAKRNESCKNRGGSGGSDGGSSSGNSGGGGGYNSVTLEECGNDSFNPNNGGGCCGNRVFISNQGCCGNDIFYLRTHFCYNESVYYKCNYETEEYNPETQLCFEHKVYPTCKGETYSITARCENNILQLQCGTVWYDASSQYCRNGSVINKGTFTDSRDGKKYKTVVIGTQTWMAENLNYSEVGKCYNNNDDYCDKYGRLYDWTTAITVCPDSWHLHTKEEWETLANFIKEDKECYDCDAKHLRTASGWNTNGNGLDTYGFAALPGGHGYSNIFSNVGNIGKWWNASEYNVNNSTYYYNLIIDYSSDVANLSYNSDAVLYSVRCIKD